MYAVIEMRANPANPQDYGKFVKLHALVDDDFAEAYRAVCERLKTDRLKMILATGVTGVTNPALALSELRHDREVQLFREFEESKRFWIIQVAPRKTPV